MNEKIKINGDATYFSKKINISDTVRISENMSSISEIAFYNVTPTVMEHIISSSNLYSKGNCIAEIVYIGESMGADRISLEIPFEFYEPVECENGIFWGECQTESVEITPIKGRRCDISAVLHIKGYILPEEEITTNFSPQEAITFYKNEKKKKVSTLHRMNKNDSFEFVHSTGFSDEVRIVYSSANILDIQTNHSPAGILINGTVHQNIIYSKRNEEDTFSYYVIEENASFNQFCEVSYGIGFTDYDVICNVCSHETLQQINDGDCRIHMNVTVHSDIMLINLFEISVTEDIFSPEYDLRCQYKNKTGITINKVQTKDIVLNFSEYTDPTDYVKILAGHEKIYMEPVSSDEGIMLNLSAISQCIGITGNTNALKKSTSSLTHNIDLSIERNTDALYVVKYITTDIIRQPKQGSITSSCKLQLNVYEISPVKISEITSYTIGEYEECASDFITVKIHFADSGEDVFGISKENQQDPEYVSNLIKNTGENKPIVIWGK